MLLVLAAVCVAAVVWSKRQAPLPPTKAPAVDEPAPEHAAGAQAQGQLRFESTPAGAEVIGPGGSMGLTPLTVDIQAGKRPKSVLFRLKGHFTQQRKVEPGVPVVNAKMLKL